MSNIKLRVVKDIKNPISSSTCFMGNKNPISSTCSTWFMGNNLYKYLTKIVSNESSIQIYQVQVTIDIEIILF